MRTFGIEIECYLPAGQTRAVLAQRLNDAGVSASAEGYNHATRSYWKVITDASLGRTGTGCEVVSPILDLEGDGLEQLRKVCEVLNAMGATVNRTCGLHVHHEARQLGVQGMRNLAALWIKYEGAVDKLMPPSRRGNSNSMLRSNRDGDYLAATETLRKADTIQAVAHVVNPHGNRYKKLNFLSFFRYGTVEFRHHSGTLEFAKMEAWVLFTAGMVAGAGRASRIAAKPESRDKLENILKLAPVAVRKFYRERAKALAGR